MKKTITVFKGDGIGPEITDCVLDILKAAGAELDYEVYNVGEAEWKRNGALIPEEAYASFDRNKVLLKSPITTPIGHGFRSLNVTLRKKYDLYANIRPAKSSTAVETPFHDVDMVIFRENTEGEYVLGSRGVELPGMAVDFKVTTDLGTRRIARAAFDYAKNNGKTHVAVVTKANIMKKTDGKFTAICHEVAADYPGITVDDYYIDIMTANLLKEPLREQFQVVLLPNLYGDIISDLCAGLVGGLGFAPSANIGDNTRIYEAVHGSAPDIAGQDKANPSAILMAFAMMLNDLGETEKAARLNDAILAQVAEGKVVTADIGGTAGTKEFTQAVIARL